MSSYDIRGTFSTLPASAGLSLIVTSVRMSAMTVPAGRVAVTTKVMGLPSISTRIV